MSDTTYPDVERHPIQLVVTDDLERNRLTVLFRLLLAIPHFVWAALWGFAVFFAIVAAWVAALFTGRVPDGLHGFIAAFVRYQTHVNAYFAIAANPFPTFTGAPGYPIDVDIAPAAPQNRLTVLFRLLLAIPAFIVLYVLQLVAQLVMILAWFYALFAGKLAQGLRDVLAYWLRYQAQTIGYVGLLTGRYPSFSDE
jgi:hypothetical protein